MDKETVPYTVINLPLNGFNMNKPPGDMIIKLITMIQHDLFQILFYGVEQGLADDNRFLFAKNLASV